MTSEEAMALAVLKGDMTAARALADAICENYERGATKIPPIVRMPDIKKVRAVIYCKDGETVSTEQLEEIEIRLTGWLTGESPILLFVGVERIELYEVP